MRVTEHQCATTVEATESRLYRETESIAESPFQNLFVWECHSEVSIDIIGGLKVQSRIHAPHQP